MNKEDLNYASALKIIEKYKAKGRTESASFLNWFLENIYRLDETAADDAICDNFNDKGVDGIRVDQVNAEIHIFQSKLRQKDDTTIGDAVLKSFAGSLDQFSSKDGIGIILAGNANDELKRIINQHKLADLVDGGYKVKGIYVCNQDCDHNTTEYLQHRQDITVYDRASIVSEYIDINSDGGVDDVASFSFDEEALMEFKAGTSAKMYMFPAQASELIALKGISDGKLFAQNVRLGLGNTKVNKDIAASISTQAEHIKFPLYHNGITLLCDKAEKKGGKIEVTNYVVVNGAQSLTTAFRNRSKVTNDLRMVAKVIEIQGNSELAREITINSNNQNAIKARDLRSNHHLQIRLKEEFDKLNFEGYQYQVKRGEEKEGDKVISNEEAGRLMLAFDLEEPWSCHQIYKVMDESYASIFGRKEVTAKRIIFIDKIWELVQGKVEKIEKKAFGHYKLTSFALLYVVSRILQEDDEGLKIFKKPDVLFEDQNKFDKFNNIVSEILDAVITDLNYEVSEMGEEFDYKSFLKSPEKVKSIVGKILASYKKDVIRAKAKSFTAAWSE